MLKTGYSRRTYSLLAQVFYSSTPGHKETMDVKKPRSFGAVVRCSLGVLKHLRPRLQLMFYAVKELARQVHPRDQDPYGDGDDRHQPGGVERARCEEGREVRARGEYG